MPIDRGAPSPPSTLSKTPPDPPGSGPSSSLPCFPSGGGSLEFLCSGLVAGSGLKAKLLGALDLGDASFVNDDLHGAKTESGDLALDDLEPGGNFEIGRGRGIGRGHDRNRRLGGRVMFAAGARRQPLACGYQSRHFQSTSVKSTMTKIFEKDQTIPSLRPAHHARIPYGSSFAGRPNLPEASPGFSKMAPENSPELKKIKIKHLHFRKRIPISRRRRSTVTGQKEPRIA